jgi:seryl-tRNA synthetase
MLDIKKIKNNTEEIRTALLKRMKPEDLDLESIIKLDNERCKLINEIDKMKSEKKLKDQEDYKKRLNMTEKEKDELIKEQRKEIKTLENYLRVIQPLLNRFADNHKLIKAFQNGSFLINVNLKDLKFEQYIE